MKKFAIAALALVAASPAFAGSVPDFGQGQGQQQQQGKELGKEQGKEQGQQQQGKEQGKEQGQQQQQGKEQGQQQQQGQGKEQQQNPMQQSQGQEQTFPGQTFPGQTFPTAPQQVDQARSRNVPQRSSAQINSTVRSCAEVQAMLAARGTALIVYGPGRYYRFQSTMGFCPSGRLSRPAVIPTADTASCIAGYVCD